MSCNGYGAYGNSGKYKGKTYKPKSRCQIAYVGSCGYADGMGVVNDGCNECGGVTPKMVAQALVIGLSAPSWDFGTVFVGALLGKQASRRLVGFGALGSSNVTIPSVISAFQKSLPFIPSGAFSGAFIKLLTCGDDVNLGDTSCNVGATTPSSCCSSSSTVSATTPSSGSCVDCSGRQDLAASLVESAKDGIFRPSGWSTHGSITISEGVITLPCRGCYVIRYIVTAGTGTIGAVNFSRVGSGTCNISNPRNFVQTTAHIIGEVAVNNCCDGCCSITMGYQGSSDFAPAIPSVMLIHRYGTC